MYGQKKQATRLLASDFLSCAINFVMPASREFDRKSKRVRKENANAKIYIYITQWGTFQRLEHLLCCEETDRKRTNK